MKGHKGARAVRDARGVRAGVRGKRTDARGARDEGSARGARAV